MYVSLDCTALRKLLGVELIALDSVDLWEFALVTEAVEKIASL